MKICDVLSGVRLLVHASCLPSNVNPGPDVDHLGNAVDLARFGDGTFSEIYASHVLEHFDYQGALMTALREWQRVLAPGGVLRLSVPDIDILAHLLLQRHRLDVNQRFQVMRMASSVYSFSILIIWQYRRIKSINQSYSPILANIDNIILLAKSGCLNG